MTMMCVRCYLEGKRVPVGARVTKDPPFAFMIYEGESRCVAHIPAPAVIEAPTLASVPDLPEEFPVMNLAREPIQTDNRFVVEEDTKPKAVAKKSVKKAPAKKRAPQQRKRTKS